MKRISPPQSAEWRGGDCLPAAQVCRPVVGTPSRVAVETRWEPDCRRDHQARRLDLSTTHRARMAEPGELALIRHEDPPLMHASPLNVTVSPRARPGPGPPSRDMSAANHYTTWRSGPSMTPFHVKPRFPQLTARPQCPPGTPDVWVGSPQAGTCAAEKAHPISLNLLRSATSTAPWSRRDSRLPARTVSRETEGRHHATMRGAMPVSHTTAPEERPHTSSPRCNESDPMRLFHVKQGADRWRSATWTGLASDGAARCTSQSAPRTHARSCREPACMRIVDSESPRVRRYRCEPLTCTDTRE